MAGLGSPVTAGEVLELIASGGQTRSKLARLTGLSRSTVAERLDVLFDAGLIREGDEVHPSGGRPSRTLTINTVSRSILAADVGEDHTRLVVTDLAGTVVAETVGAFSVSRGAEEIIDWIITEGQKLLTANQRQPYELIGVAMGVPAPVDYARGVIASPSVMTGWEGVALDELIQNRLDVPVVVENDVNARGFGEYLQFWKAHDEIFYIKAGTGIGSAIISAGSLFRGAKGAAGDIGHIQLDPEEGPLCRCGAVGCVEALAAGWSIVRDLQKQGFEIADTREVMALAANGSPEAIHLLRQAGRTLGRAIAYGVNLLNPSLVVVGGSLTGVGSHLLMGIRESVYQYSLPLATRDLQIEQGKGGEQTGAIGAAHLVIRRVLQPDRINSHLRSLVD